MRRSLPAALARCTLCLTVTIPGALVPAQAAAQRTVPSLDHVFVIMMENRSYAEVIGNPDAPFINRLAREANLATRYFAVGHPSLTNYLELVGGSNFGVSSDDNPDWHRRQPGASVVEPISGSGTDAGTPAATAPEGKEIAPARYRAVTIADQLAAAGKRWKSYQESLPPGGADGVDYADGSFSNRDAPGPAQVQRLYAAKHDPFVYFAHVQDGTDDHDSLRNVAGFSGRSGLYADLASGKLPDFAFIAPNQCHDMHGVSGGSAWCTDARMTMRAGDRAVERIIGAIRRSPAWQRGRNAIVLLWDENDFSPTPNRVAAIVDTSYGRHGVCSDVGYSHFSLLKTLEQAFGLPCINHACDANVASMSDLFSGN